MVQRSLTRDQKEEKITAKSVAERTLENQLAFGKDRGKNIVAPVFWTLCRKFQLAFVGRFFQPTVG